GPASGTLTAAAEYEPALQRLTMTSAKARTDDLAGELEGTIGFGEGMPPTLDLHVRTTQLPLRALLDTALEGRLDDIGDVAIALHEPSAVRLDLTGTPGDPIVAVAAQLAGADL